MGKKRHRIHLTTDERDELGALLRRKVLAHRKRQRAQILLFADEQRRGGGLTDVQIAAALNCGTATIERVRAEFCDQGMKALERATSKRVYKFKLDGAAEAQLVATCCGPPPEGHARWSLRLLSDRLVELQVVPAISHETVRRTLAANELKPWLKQQWCLSPHEQQRVRAADGRRARRLPPPA